MHSRLFTAGEVIIQWVIVIIITYKVTNFSQSLLGIVVSFLFVALFFLPVIARDFCLKIELRPSPMLSCTASVSVTFAQILGEFFQIGESNRTQVTA